LVSSFSAYRDKKVVGVFVRFRAPLQADLRIKITLNLAGLFLIN
jgi:hypothetical protein